MQASKNAEGLQRRETADEPRCVLTWRRGAVKTASVGPLREVENEVFHARAGQLFAGLARQHHQDDPLELGDIQLLGVERHQALDDDLTLLRREDPGALELQQVSGAHLGLVAAGFETQHLQCLDDVHRRARYLPPRSPLSGGAPAPPSVRPVPAARPTAAPVP